MTPTYEWIRRVNAINVGWTLTDNEHKLQRVEMGSDNWIEEADKVKQGNLGNSQMCRVLKKKKNVRSKQAV